MDAPEVKPAGPVSRVWDARVLALVVFLVALVARVGIILAAPHNYAFDAFQRWAGRDVFLVQGWLPATQAIIRATASLGGDVVATRVVLAAVASLGVAAGVLAAEKLGGRVAAWAFLVFSCFAPALVWTGAMYQEGTYLAVLYVAVALAVHDRLRLADLVIGLVGLVRYEGWPAVMLWVVWRRDPRALLAGWGMGAWLFARYALHVRGHALSPVDFDDWEGLTARTTVASWFHDAWKLTRIEWLSGGFTELAFAAAGAWSRWRQPWVAYMLLNLGAQLAALAGWLAGLEVATYRMLVVPTAVACLPAALGAAWAWERWPRWRKGLVVALAVFLGVAAWESQREARVETRGSAWERHAARLMDAQCPECVWLVYPRGHIGTRDRHDGCEILQGVLGWHHGKDFVCATWPDAATYTTQGEARWTGMGYRVLREPIPGMESQPAEIAGEGEP